MKLSTKNLALSGKYNDEVLTTFIPIIDAVTESREQMEDDWERFINMYNQKDDGHRGYNSGRANAYIPELKKIVRTNMIRAKRSIWPVNKEPAIGCVPNVNIKDEDLCQKAVRALALHDLKQMNYPNHLDSFLLQYILLGTGVMKGMYCEKKGHIFTKPGAEEKEIYLYRGPKVEFRSIFDIYVYPDTVQSQDKITMWIERLEYSFFELEKLVEQGIFPRNVLELRDAGDDTRAERQPRSDIAALQGVQTASELVKTPVKSFIAYQIWTEHEFERGGPRQYCIEIIPSIKCVTRIQRNPYPTQKAPYFIEKYIPSPEATFYGQGAGHAIDKLQYLLNDIANQGLDSAVFLNNPSLIVDLGLCAMNPNEIDFSPGSMLFGNKDAFSPLTVGDPALPNVSFNAMSLVRSIISDHAGEPQIPDALQGKARSATQAQMVGQESKIDLLDPVMKIEQSVLIPSLEFIYDLRAFYYDKDVYTRILGDKIGGYESIVTSQENFQHRYIWTWTGATETENEFVRNQQRINFLNIITKLPPELMQGIDIKWDNMLVNIWEGLGFKESSDTLISKEKTTDPRIENQLARNDQFYDVYRGDNDDMHLPIHYADFDKLNKKQQILMAEHIEKHEAQKKDKEAQLRAMQQKIAEMQAMQIAQQGGGQSPAQGRQPQLPSGMNAGDQTRGMRMT